MRAGIIVQARLTSSGFPNKVLATLKGKPVLAHVLERAKRLFLPLVVAIPDNESNDALASWLKENNYKVFRGKEYDVLDRFFQCAKRYQFDIIIRLNGETPFIEPLYVIENVNEFILTKQFIYGNGSWVFSFNMLKEAWMNDANAKTRQHVVRRFFNSIDYPEDIKRLENW